MKALADTWAPFGGVTGSATKPRSLEQILPGGAYCVYPTGKPSPSGCSFEVQVPRACRARQAPSTPFVTPIADPTAADQFIVRLLRKRPRMRLAGVAAGTRRTGARSQRSGEAPAHTAYATMPASELNDSNAMLRICVSAWKALEEEEEEEEETDAASAVRGLQRVMNGAE
jgi:hypothetical protein